MHPVDLADLVDSVHGNSGVSELREWIWWIQVMDLLGLLYGNSESVNLENKLMDSSDGLIGFTWFSYEFNESMFFLQNLVYNSELPISRYATSARSFDTNPMEYLPGPRKHIYVYTYIYTYIKNNMLNSFV